MKTMDIIEENPKIEKLLLTFGKNNSLSNFLNKKRLKSDGDSQETTIKFIEDKKFCFFPFINKNMTQYFLETYFQILNNSQFKNNTYFLNEKKIYFDFTFNLKLVNDIINYFSKVKSRFKNANLFNLKDLKDLTKTFLINDIQFSILSLLIDEYISKFIFTFKKENIYYLGLYTKYITSDFYADVFNEILNKNIFFKFWYLQNKLFLENLDISVAKINKRNNSSDNQKIERIDFDLMVHDIIFPKREKKENKKFNVFKSNIGKKINVVVVYQEDLSQDNTNYIEAKDFSHNGNEPIQSDIIIQI